MVYMAIIDMVGNHSYFYGSSNNTDKVVEGFRFVSLYALGVFC